MTTCRMRITYWIPKATNTHQEYVIYTILTAFPCTNAPHCYGIGTMLVFILLWHRKVIVTDAYTFYVIRTIVTITNHHFATQTVLDLGRRISFLEVRENPNFFDKYKEEPCFVPVRI